ncbi:MAG TPA: hypothetical protein DCY97_00795 [Marinilabiliales bacterium]|nr:hypothetical protein [Marinilabiliales bacterium]
MTTLDGSSRSQSEVHKEVEEGKNRADLRYVRRILNWIVLPLLEKRGFKVKGGKFIFPEAAEPLTVENVVSLSKIMPIPVSYLRDKYSIPEPQEGEEIAGEAASPKASPQPPPKEGEKEKQPVDKDGNPIENADHTPSLSGRDGVGFFRRLYDFFASAPGSGALNGNRLTLDDTEGLTQSETLIRRVADGLRTFDPDLFDWLARDLISALDTPVQTGHALSLADLGFAYNYQNDAFRTAQELNLFHFSAAKSLAEIQRLNELYRQSKSFEDFYKAASAELDVFNKTWQKTEWQTAGLIAASTQNYNRLAAKTKLFPYWEYRTVGDDKVRPEHAKLHGVILPANDPRWKKIWPPNGWKCRCYVVARMAHEVKDVDFDAMRARVDAYFETEEWKSAEAQGFGVNRALSPELFKADQMYIKKFPNQAAKLLKDVNFNSYGLKSYKAMRGAVTGDLPLYDGTAGDFIASLQKQAGKSLFTDYNGRAIEFDESVFLKGHSPAKYAARTKYFKAVSETLKSPDEVWINNVDSTEKLFNQYVFLKYYKDVTLAVIGAIEEGTVYRVKTWFPVRENARTKYAYRWGLLIKKPGN